MRERAGSRAVATGVGGIAIIAAIVIMGWSHPVRADGDTSSVGDGSGPGSIDDDTTPPPTVDLETTPTSDSAGPQNHHGGLIPPASWVDPGLDADQPTDPGSPVTTWPSTAIEPTDVGSPSAASRRPVPVGPSSSGRPSTISGPVSVAASTTSPAPEGPTFPPGSADVAPERADTDRARSTPMLPATGTTVWPSPIVAAAFLAAGLLLLRVSRRATATGSPECRLLGAIGVPVKRWPDHQQFTPDQRRGDPGSAES